MLRRSPKSDTTRRAETGSDGASGYLHRSKKRQTGGELDGATTEVMRSPNRSAKRKTGAGTVGAPGCRRKAPTALPLPLLPGATGSGHTTKSGRRRAHRSVKRPRGGRDGRSHHGSRTLLMVAGGATACCAPPSPPFRGRTAKTVDTPGLRSGPDRTRSRTAPRIMRCRRGILSRLRCRKRAPASPNRIQTEIRTWGRRWWCV